MFRKNNTSKPQGDKKGGPLSIVTRDMHILGNIVSEGVIDFDGTLEGNIRCRTLTIRANAQIKGEVSADAVYVYGKVKGLIRAKHVYFYASCNVEGIILHEAVTIEDGAFVDGKFKRTDKLHDDSQPSAAFSFEETDEESGGATTILENIRLIR